MLTNLMGGEMTVKSTPGVGSTFQVRLFLPELAPELAGPPAAASGPQRRQRVLGPAPRVLVVDNEEADRGFLVDLLAPLGFDVQTAASGEEALQRLAAAVESAGQAPQAIFMDLAMPGIDGWETIRRLRAEGLSSAPVAIVSANAFDRALENDVGIGPADFFVKPVRVHDLLGWLQGQLQLRWSDDPLAAARPPEGAASDTAAQPAAVLPPQADLDALLEAASLGYPKGLLAQLAALEARDPRLAQFVQSLREPVRRFDFDRVERLLRQASNAD